MVRVVKSEAQKDHIEPYLLSIVEVPEKGDSAFFFNRYNG